jgi:hypothetical protein
MILTLIFIISPIIQADSTIELYTIDDLWNIRDDLSGHYILMNDLDFGNIDDYEGTSAEKSAKMTENTTGFGWLPIGNYDNEFTGIFNGRNYSISNLFVNRENDIGLGFFGYSFNSTMININLIDVDISGYDSVGGLIGFCMGTISKCLTTGSVTGVYYVGGLVGDSWDSFITNSHSEVQVQGETCVGGLIGSNAESFVEQSYATGDVNGITDYDNTMGGLIGYNAGTIVNCYATGHVVSEGIYSWYIGGLIGENDEGSFISNCYSTGFVDGNSVVGGLIGGGNPNIVENCFWDKQTSSQGSSAGGAGKTTIEMKNYNTYNDSGWNIAKIQNHVDETWFINHTIDYPHLGWEPTYITNRPPNTPSNPNPFNNSMSIPLNENLSWNGGDPDPGDTVKYNIYFGTNSEPQLIKSNHTNTIYDPGEMNSYTKYYWKIVAKDNHESSVTSPIWDFTTIYINLPPNTPSIPKPNNQSIKIGINADLSWTGGDPNDNDTVTYDIYFGTNNTPTLKESNHTSISYEPGILNYSTKYYWKIVAKDKHGLTSDGPIWSFTTGAQSSGGSSSGGGGSQTPMPIANASASDNRGLVNITVRFDASYSYHENGEITNYTWDFNDGNYGYGKITNHIYIKDGIYRVKLTVTDDYDLSDTDTLNVTISQINNPPTTPLIEGPKIGRKNIEYNFSIFSIDPENDNIQYVINWGDDQTNETDFVTNGTIYTAKHKWFYPGIYKIDIYAIDSKNSESDSAESTILIDVIYCKNFGYLIDENSDGIYDKFYNNETGNKTDLQNEEENYQIDLDGDDTIDYIYNISTNILTEYKSSKEDKNEEESTVIYIIAISIIIILIILYLISRQIKGKNRKR